MFKSQIKQDEPVICDNIIELYCFVTHFIDEYHAKNPENQNHEACSEMIKKAFPQMKDNRIHKAVTAIMVNAGLCPSDPEYTHFCPQCLIEWIHEAEAAFPN